MILTHAELASLTNVASAEADKLGFTTPCDRGHVLQRERIAFIAERCCEAMPGDLIEVGTYAGVTTAILADIARKYGRTLVCIDDFMPRKGFDHTIAAYEFQKVLLKHGDVIEWHCLDAHSLEAVKKIQSHRYCFAFADAGHDYHESLTELIVLMECTDGIITKDDCYLPHMPAAIQHAMRMFGEWELIGDGRLSEWYLQRGTP